MLFTSESVTSGHPDKICDIISDSILDAYLEKDKYARVAVETLVKDNHVVVAGEITSYDTPPLESIVRDAICSIGYDDPELGFDGMSCTIDFHLTHQSPDIAQGVDHAFENGHLQGAGDQGIMFGYACKGTMNSVYMPDCIVLAHQLTEQLENVRKSGQLSYLRPDGKSQVTGIFEDNQLVGIDTVVVSTQHDPDIDIEQLRNDIKEYVIRPIVPVTLQTNVLINTTGRFVIGGPVGDAGVTGRKIIVDTYGGSAPHGGGAFSGKDPSKVDRSAAYAARWVAKNIVAADIAKECMIQLSYAIGVPYPVSIFVNTRGTGIISDDRLAQYIYDWVDFSPKGIIDTLDLLNPIYAKTATNGHFGNYDFPWEQLNLVERFRELI